MFILVVVLACLALATRSSAFARGAVAFAGAIGGIAAIILAILLLVRIVVAVMLAGIAAMFVATIASGPLGIVGGLLIGAIAFLAVLERMVLSSVRRMF